MLQVALFFVFVCLIYTCIFVAQMLHMHIKNSTGCVKKPCHFDQPVSMVGSFYNLVWAYVVCLSSSAYEKTS